MARSLAVLVGLLAALVVAEFGLRAAGRLYYALSGRGPGGPDGAAGSGLRVLCHGDSNVFGIYERAGESYPAQLAAILDARARGGPHDVFNLGVPGLGSRQLLSVIAHDLERVDPHTVLVTVGANDAWRWTPEAGVEYVEPPFWEELRLAKLVRLIAYRSGRGRVDRGGGPHGDLALVAAEEGEGETWSIENREGERVRRYSGTVTTDHADDAEYWRLLRADLARLGELVGDRLVLVCYGSEGTAYGKANAVFREVAAETGIRLVDPTGDLRELVERTGFADVFWADLHPRGLGYEVIARACYDELVARGVADGEPFADRLEGLRRRARERPPIELVGSLADPGGPVLEITGEEPNRNFGVVLWDAHRGEEPPPARTYFEVVENDAIYKRSFRSEALRGRFDDEGSGRVRLRPFLGERDDLAGLRLRAGYIVYAGDGHEVLSRFSDPVVIELR